MAEITAKAVRDLREATGLPMMECKKALTECDGDPEAADSKDRFSVWAMSTTNQWIGLLAVALLFLLVRRLGYCDRTALMVALAAGRSRPGGR